MSDHKQFIEQAKNQIDKLGNELNDLDEKVKTDCQDASAWYGEQLSKLRSDWQDANAKINKLAADGQAGAQESFEQAKSEAEHHWKALQAAVQTYRDKVERTVSNS